MNVLIVCNPYSGRGKGVKFAKKIQNEINKEKIHTTVETALNLPQNQFSSLLPLVDLWKVDCKLIDSSRHKQATGAENSRILENIEFLSRQNVSLTVNIPLIPGINDDEENLTQTAEFLKSLPHRPNAELLAFHKMAENKFDYGIIGGGLEETVAAVEALAVFVHLIAHDAGSHRVGHLCGAGGFGSIAEHSGEHSQVVDYSLAHRLQCTAVQIGHGAAGTHSRSDGGAVGGQPAYVFFQVHGHKVGQSQSPVHLFAAAAQAFGIFQNRHGNCKPLVAAAAHNDHRFFTAAHTGIGAGCCPGHCSRLCIAGIFQKDTPYLGSPRLFQPLLGYGTVAVYLAVQQVGNVLNLHSVYEVPHSLKAHKAVVRGKAGAQQVEAQIARIGRQRYTEGDQQARKHPQKGFCGVVAQGLVLEFFIHINGVRAGIVPLIVIVHIIRSFL